MKKKKIKKQVEVFLGKLENLEKLEMKERARRAESKGDENDMEIDNQTNCLKEIEQKL